MKDLPVKNPKKDLSEPLFFLAALLVSCYFCQLKFLLCEPFAGLDMFEKVAHYTGPKPWQYRVLVPSIANILNLLELPLINSLFRWARVLEMVFLFFLVVAFRSYLFLFIKNKRVCSLLSFFIFFILPFQVLFPRPYYANYWYDTPSLLFFTLGLTFLYQKKWVFYYVLFIVATLNRETTCFLAVIYLFTSLGREKPAKIFFHCAAQLILWMTIKAVLARIFIGNPGANGFEWEDRPGVTHFADNISFFADPRNYLLFLSNMGFLWIPVLAYYGRIKNEFIRKSLWVVLPFFIGMMFVANIYELRIFQELVPLFLVAFFLILIDRIGPGPTA